MSMSQCCSMTPCDCGYAYRQWERARVVALRDLLNQVLAEELSENTTLSNKHVFEIEEADRQALVLAIAKLTISRPGWNAMLRRIAESLSGAAMFDEFVSHGPEILDASGLDPASEVSND